MINSKRSRLMLHVVGMNEKLLLEMVGLRG